MDPHSRQSSMELSTLKSSQSAPEETILQSTGPVADLLSPVGNIDGLERDDFREIAYEVFFTACRSCPGFGGRHAIPYYKSSSSASADGGGDGSALDSGSSVAEARPGVGMVVTSRVKKDLGLKMINRSRRSSSIGSELPSSPKGSSISESSTKVGFTLPPQRGRLRRRMTSAEIMKQQMRITDQCDNRLRKTLMRTLVGQMGRHAETIILPLELLRHLKPSEFNNGYEYHTWQKRQLRILEAGLVLHPVVPLEKSNTFAATLRELVNSSEMKEIDTGRNSETMRALCNCVIALAWRNPFPGSTEVCHWADGYPLNVHIYNALLFSLFDLTDETSVLDEIDELLELMKKTWSVLGIDKPIHNLCFTWMLFEQYVMTGQAEPDLLRASLAILAEVTTDAKRPGRDPTYKKLLPCILDAISKWCGKKLYNYHENFSQETIGLMQNILLLLFSCTKILEESVPSQAGSSQQNVDADDELRENTVDRYIRLSMRNAFTKMVEDQTSNGTGNIEAQEASKKLIKLAKKTEELAAQEKEIYSPVLKKWHPVATGVASVALHTCYGCLLKQYLNGKSGSLNEALMVLHRAGKLEKALVKIVVDDSVDCEDGGKSIVRQMVPYEVDTVIAKLLKHWIQEKLQKGQEHLLVAKQTESWNPKSKTQPYAQSAKELVSFATETTEKFFEAPINMPENVLHDLIDGLDSVFTDYISFVAGCGAKQSYLPTLPPLTRCCHDSKLVKLWKKTTCGVGLEDALRSFSGGGKNPSIPTSRGTQRLYIRLNTLSYLDSQLHALEKTLSASSKVTPSKDSLGSRNQPGSSYFERSHSAFQVASQHVSEVAAYRLIFLDTYSVFYGSLYVGNIAKARITLALQMLEQNLTLLCTIVVVQAQPLALREVMRASFEAFLRVLLAGGNSRIFTRLDHPMIEEDVDNLKRVFCGCGEGMILKDMVDKEAEEASGVVELMGQSTEQLVENFRAAATETCLIGTVGTKPRILMPPTTGKWSKSDPNTILRVLCCRNDRLANRFLKKTFHLPKRRFGNKMI